MKNLDEKLYDYLSAQTEPKSIGEINGAENFRDIPRRELSQILQSLTVQRLARRNLKQGKAYYSFESSDGVDYNPAKNNIENIQAKLKGVFNQEEEVDEEVDLSALIELMKSLSDLSEEFDFDDETPATSTDFLKLTYDEGIIFENDTYSFAVPDGFVLVSNPDMNSNESDVNREFIAWLPDPEYPDSQDDALIQILPSMETEMLDSVRDVRNPEIQIVAWKYNIVSKLAKMGMADTMKILDIPTESEAYTCLYSPDSVRYNYFVHFFPCKKDKQIRIDVKGVKKENEEYSHQMICELAHGFISKDRPEPIKRLDDASYLEGLITETIAKEWLENLNLKFNEISILTRLNYLLTETLLNNAISSQSNYVKIKNAIREIMEEARARIEDVLEQTNVFIKAVSKANSGNKPLLNIYLELIKIIEANKVLEYDLEGELLKEEVYRAEETIKIWKTTEIDELLNSHQADLKNRDVEEERKVADSILKETEDFICEGRELCRDLDKNWEELVEEVQTILSMKSYKSEEEFYSDVLEMVRQRNEFGESYNNLIQLVDKNGKILLNNGGDYRTVMKIADYIDEIIEESSGLKFGFTATGTINGELGDLEFSVSSLSQSNQEWWRKKCEYFPEIKAEKKRSRLKHKISTNEERIFDLKEKGDELKAQSNLLKNEIAYFEKKIREGERELDSAKKKIAKKIDQEQKKLQLKIDEMSDKINIDETKLNELKRQLDGLSIFKRSQKKDLSNEISNLRGINFNMRNIMREQEMELNDIKKRSENEVAALLNAIDEIKNNLKMKNEELNFMLNQIMEIERKIDNEKSKLDKKMTEIAEFEKSILGG